ncbi:developmentally-regulated LLR repeat protein [Acrasis kona]|uniref:Leucine-rich repeat-containing protein 51 n=1 Tax=Acrasis kona TaxID=1008807 RepID=A0AAW2YUY8_9EUKA
MLRCEPRNGKRRKIERVVETKVKESVQESELTINRNKMRSTLNATKSSGGVNTSPTNLMKMTNSEPKDKNEDKNLSKEVTSTIEYSGYLGGAIKLSNNNLFDLDSLMEVAKKIMDDSSLIKWLDLSYNNFASLQSVEALPLDLEVLYLHGNNISEVKEITRLSKFKNLRSLTLHGNPLDEVRNYRYHILALLPSLKILDFAAVTKKDVDTANTFNLLYLKKPTPVKKKQHE